jgi:hypothetical protein
MPPTPSMLGKLISGMLCIVIICAVHKWAPNHCEVSRLAPLTFAINIVFFLLNSFEMFAYDQL